LLVNFYRGFYRRQRYWISSGYLDIFDESLVTFKRVSSLRNDMFSNVVVQRVAVGAGGRPQVVRPESRKVVLAPLLRGFGLVARSGVLLENVVAVGEGDIQPRLNDLFHDLLVLLGANLEALGEPVRRHSRAVGGHDAQHHGRGGDLVNAIGHKPVALGVASLVHGPGFLSFLLTWASRRSDPRCLLASISKTTGLAAGPIFEVGAIC